MSNIQSNCAPNTFAPPELISFVERQVRDAQPYPWCERRLEKRNLMVVPVLGRAVDDDYHPIDEPFWLVSRDISSRGIGLVHMDRFEHKLLVLQMAIAGEEVVVVTKIEWQRDTGPFCSSGATFVAKLEHFPS